MTVYEDIIFFHFIYYNIISVLKFIKKYLFMNIRIKE